jgi:succinyl-diaminopimelate desuccinylase
MGESNVGLTPRRLIGASDAELGDAIVSLARRLIAIDGAAPGGELAAATLVAEVLSGAGIDVGLLPFDGDRANLVARVGGSSGHGALTLSGHLDTVPVGPQASWSVPPHGGVVRDGRLYGRGALDMKGPVAAMVIALLRLSAAAEAPAGDIVLALTAGEEIDSRGARLLAEGGHLDGTAMIVVGESTGFDVGIAHRGALWLRVETQGALGHGSLSSRQDTALCRLVEWLHPFQELEDLLAAAHDDLLGHGRVTLTMLSGGDAPNVVPGQASAVLDLRTVPAQRHASLIEALHRRAEGVSITVLRDSPPVPVAPRPLIDASVRAVTAVTGRRPRELGLPYLTDASVLVDVLGVPAVVVGPGAPEQAHSFDEHVPVVELVKAMHVFEHIAMTTSSARRDASNPDDRRTT